MQFSYLHQKRFLHTQIFNMVKLNSINKDSKKKILITVGLLLVCRVLAAIPTPGVNLTYFKALLNMNSSFGFYNALSGNGLESLSLMTLSITPYITASIVMQLLGVVFKRIQELQQGMKDDREKLELITIIFGGVLAFFQALAMAIGFGSKGLLKNFTWYWVIIVAILWTGFAVLSTVIGKMITKRGIGNGISLILLTNILISYPNDIATLINKFVIGKKIGTQIISAVLLLVLIIFMFAFTYFLQESQKEILVNYSGKVQYGKNKMTNKIPLKLCPGGVVPIIFASTILTTPIMIASLFGYPDQPVLNLLNSGYWFHPEKPIYSIGAIIYIALIFGFSYFYTNITLNPNEIADKIKKNGGNISGIRAGKPTAEYLERQMKYMTALGAATLTIIAMVPIILSGVWGIYSISFLGTSIIITVGVILETKKILEMELKKDEYHQMVHRGGLFHG